MYDSLKLLFIIGLCLMLAKCGNDNVLPKPSGQLALDYPEANYVQLDTKDCPFSFQVNEFARVLSKRDCSMKIEYPQMEATLYLTYRPVKDNLRELLIDGQKLSYDHNQKADVIKDFPFANELDRTYGMMYEIEGNAASNAQFYVTDSLNHFLTASLYFYSQPNYDSILPAADYVKKDMIKMLESLRWQN
ncbi:gliding motility lipoprotein GldD [Nonlabens xiamenensis]|uniref:gliding motility lipoprotein GldD n=1 Tax=Nonlabens xiamenensis TaxID=2341043 RepID=UPI000F60E06E|nr:gliding motility lipoprotein GldD [Nonlabens xiamenensis]